MRVLVLLLFLLSGCLSAQDPVGPPTAPADSEPGGWSFEEFQVGTAQNTQREAFLAVSPDGQDILVCGHGYFQRPAHLWHSDDGGASFQEVSFPPETGVSGDCEVAMDGDAWMVLHSQGDAVTVTTSFDGGETWNVQPLAAVPINGGADRPWMAFVDGVLMITFMPLSLQPGTIGFARSLDHGATWSTTEWLVPPSADGPLIQQGDFVVSPDNATIRVPLSRSDGTTTRLSFAVSDDLGQTWREAPVPMVPALHENPVGVTQAGDGRLYWAFPGDAGLMLTTSPDGEHWTDPFLLGPGIVWERPWASGRSDGSAVVVWESDGTETNTTETTLVAALVRPDGNVTYDAFMQGPLTEFMSVVHGASDRAYIAVAYSSNPQRTIPNPSAQTSDFYLFRQR